MQIGMGSCETCTLVSTIVHYFRNVVCLKFGEVWETPWIFKVARWMCDRWPKINKSPTVSNGIGASFFEIWTANLAQLLTVGTLTNSQSFILGNSFSKFCKVGYPVGPPKTRHSDADISDLGFLLLFFCFYFFSEKIKTCWIYKNAVFANREKYKVSWNFCLVFIIDF